jgi:recombinational DNA repair ATPase RecF
MKILKLDIKHLRGIPDLKIEPKGKSLVVYGSNGSGKSAVIDALDFLLTGKIARLIGEGTEGVSLKDHGPHIDMVADLSKVIVSATIQVPGITEPVELKRSMKKPAELVYDSKFTQQLTPLIELLNRGQYVFTRREILKLITAKSSTRAQEIQKVLKLSDLEDVRTTLVKVYNESKKDHKVAQDALLKAQNDVIFITGHGNYLDADILNFINEQRVKLGAAVIHELKTEKFQESISGVQVNPISVNHENFTDRLSLLKYSKSQENRPVIEKAQSLLSSAIKGIKSDPLANWNSKRYKLTELGISLIPESGECPLCDSEWPVGDLNIYLQDRLETVSKRQTEIKDNSAIIKERANILQIRIRQLIEVIQPVINNELIKESEISLTQLDEFSQLSNSLSKLTKALDNPLEEFLVDTFSEEDVNNLYLTPSNETSISAFEAEIKKLFPEATPEQSAWDNLTKLIERMKIVGDAERNLQNAKLVLDRAEALGVAYVEARDEVLDGLYTKIKDKFVQLYKDMHGDDEIGFNAVFLPQEAGLGLSVDFYGRGYHPPHAMHSEGHQDSMGICLFLALSEHLNTGLIDLVILDDVVMSVDTGHRRAFCNVLIKHFPDKQFIITTHDTTWANQLKSVGLVPGKQMLKFSNWSVEDGPMIHYEADMWGRIQADLDIDDVSAAAAKLRRGMEEFSRFVCHNLKAYVPYTLDDAGSLGDFLPAAIGRYKDLLGKAKDAANSWNQAAVVDDLKKIDDNSKAIIAKTNAEQWNVNKAVHYNEWANLRKEDFQPVVNAFKELYEDVFSCANPECQAVLHILQEGPNVTGVKCKCGNTNWNLNKK